MHLSPNSSQTARHSSAPAGSLAFPEGKGQVRVTADQGSAHTWHSTDAWKACKLLHSVGRGEEVSPLQTDRQAGRELKKPEKPRETQRTGNKMPGRQRSGGERGCRGRTAERGGDAEGDKSGRKRPPSRTVTRGAGTQGGRERGGRGAS